MATKEDATKAAAKATSAKTAEPATPKDTSARFPADLKSNNPPDADLTGQPRVSTCVVNDGRGRHVGNAVNGLVCSYHAMHYNRNGNRR